LQQKSITRSGCQKTNQKVISGFKVQKDTSAALSMTEGYFATTQYDKYPQLNDIDLSFDFSNEDYSFNIFNS